jgi:hypothetical protein
MRLWLIAPAGSICLNLKVMKTLAIPSLKSAAGQSYAKGDRGIPPVSFI